ncbi:alkaline phosphatase [Lacihabitans sp. LS3-19]|uniref:alkaline phosphatase D family protein n=1 Tax=Lacihabitans sp. LS3-19 TaxID=2487335 RepID=UPI0020CC4BA3|nr:alkaline phosphatase D family protein [Lacihabitans sp. LS3-19]MCP9767838.1 alkaline phosphatase [Lacihabitans sp. LS3-19]
MIKDKNVNRREFVKKSSFLAFLGSGIPLFELENQPSVYQAMGTRVGEITDSSAVVWVRSTLNSSRNNEGLVIPGRAQDYKKRNLPIVNVPVEELEGATPGTLGYVRLIYGIGENLKDQKTTKWIEVSEKTDYTHHFHLINLKSGSTYFYASQASLKKGKNPITTHKGQFNTAPESSIPSNFIFTLMTCQGYPDRGHKDGHQIYPSMLSLKPKFAFLTGDLVYYDNDMPRANSPRLARYHWERMFSLPRLVEFNSNVGTYWLKDDHDTLNDDSSPGESMGDLTFEKGQDIFRQQAPMYDGLSYRTFRWGKDLQIWLSDGRDFRSQNDMDDGPEKTIWGKEQKDWFKKTVKESDATWKILVSPTPLVGPDRKQKNDNHSNLGFKHEGDEIRNWLKDNVPDNFFVICGDRHWQYHSVHPETGLNEFSIGAASDEHAQGSPGENKMYHRFHLVKGGFMSVELRSVGSKSSINFRHHDIYGKEVYAFQKDRVL